MRGVNPWPERPDKTMEKILSVSSAQPRQSRILVVDDEPSTLTLLTRMLSSGSYRVDCAKSGIEALKKITDFRPDIVLTDITMSGMTGLELLKKIRETNALMGVILMTGSVNIETAIEAIRLGAYEYLVKPFPSAILIASVERVLTKSKFLVENEQYHTYLQKTFRKYVDPGVLSVLLSAHKTAALESRKLNASVFFSDIRNFSELFLHADVKQLIGLMNEFYFKPACEIVQANGGTIDKFIGDGVMAVFGAPLFFAGHATKAVDAALALTEIMRETRSKGLHPFEIGIGIASGEVVSGNIGSPTRMDFTVMGNAVTVAARLEKLAGPGVILVDLPTRLLFGDSHLVSKPLSLRLRGQKTVTDLYEVRRKGEIIPIPTVERREEPGTKGILEVLR
jgi:adenylate cyclase